jgi:tetratricopeptide (TPR) repeat protein
MEHNYPEERRRASLLNNIGIELCKEGKFKEAQRLFEEAIKISPNYAHPRINLAKTLIEDFRYSQAEFQLRKALEFSIDDNKTQQDIWNNLGCLRFEQKNYQEAIKFYEKAISVYQADEIIYRNMGISYEKLGEWKEALRCYNYSNTIYSNLKARLSMELIQQLMYCSPKMNGIIERYINEKQRFITKQIKESKSIFPECGNNCLSSNELELVRNISNDSFVFLAGAGLSFPRPSCLPLASQILREVFHFIFEIDKKDICDILQMSADIDENNAYKKLSQYLYGKDDLPFEATFQALYDTFGFPVIRFVELLEAGEPNLHHKMLAHALYKGHIVITTNFDQQIEKAYKKIFSEEPPHILITDRDYQNAIDNNRLNGILAKIHGDIKDYNSLLLTLEGLVVRGDRTIHIDDDIDMEKHRRQVQLAYPKSTLSIPKALFLQTILQNKKIVVMGYSASDTFDIMPILKSSEFKGKGLWINHDCHITDEVNKWKCNGKDRTILYPKTEQEKNLDITSKVSRYFLELFGATWQKESDQKRTDDKDRLTFFYNTFKTWIYRLGFRHGDGLVCLAKLHEQRGDWIQAVNFYQKALPNYERDMKHNEFRWLSTKLALGSALANSNRKDKALKNFKGIKKYIEKNKRHDFYPDLYANTLINIALKWINTIKDKKANKLIEKAIEIAKQIEDNLVLDYGLRVAADRHFIKKEYEKALKLYLEVHQRIIDCFGDGREACQVCIRGALCFANLGEEYKATQILAEAEMYAKLFGDQCLINAVRINQHLISARFSVTQSTKDLHEKLKNDAIKYLDNSSKNEIYALMDYIRFEQYPHALQLADDLLKKYEKKPDTQAYLLFLKSNIYQRIKKPNEEIEILKKFCKIKPQHPLAEHNLGLANSRLHNYNMAKKHFHNAISIMKGKYPLAICNLGILYAQQGNLKAAMEQLLKAQKLNAPENSLKLLRNMIDELKRNPGRRWTSDDLW